MLYLVIITILLSGFSSVSVQAQWTKSFSVSTSYDNNAFRNYAGLSDNISQFSGYFAKDFSSEKWQSRLYYRGSYSLFAQYDARNYHYHQLGGAFSRVLSDGGNTLNLGINSSLRVNGTIYDYYNFQDASVYGNVKIVINSASNANLGYRLHGRRYSNLPDLNYSEHYFFARYIGFFQTRTTLMVESNYGLKIYQSHITGTQPVQEDGQGFEGYGTHRGGMGHFGNTGSMGDNSHMSEIESNNTNPGVGQWIGQFRLAQSLTNATGLRVEFTLRRNPGGEIRYLAGQVSGYISEDELFDDHYGYESEELGTTLTQIFSGKVTLKASIDTRWKDYVKRNALDLNGDPVHDQSLRKDREVQFWFSLGKSFSMPGGKSISLMGEFYWIDNRSNDLYYNYQVSLISLGAGMLL